MSIAVLVRRNVLDPYRSRSLFVLLGVFVLVFGMIGYLLGGNSTPLSFVVVTIMAPLAPLAALAFTYESIAGPRQSGSLRVLLSYPYTRRELVLGTLIGRTIVLALAVSVGLLAAVVSTTVFGGTVDVATIVPVALLSILLSTTIVGVAMGISASVRSSSLAAVGAFGAYLLFTGLWGSIPGIVRYVLNGFSFALPPETPTWVEIWNQLSPTKAYQNAAGVVMQQPAAGDAFYYSAWFAVLVLVGWFVLAVGLGVLRFERTDL